MYVYLYTHIYIHIYIHIYKFIYMCIHLMSLLRVLQCNAVRCSVLQKEYARVRESATYTAISGRPHVINRRVMVVIT